jgi:hypothetical protein
MGSIPRSCTEEYEVPAVTVVMDAHASMADVERNNGVQEMTLGKWPKETGTRKEPYRLGKKRCRLLPHQSTSCGPSDVPAPACFGLAQRSWHQSLAISVTVAQRGHGRQQDTFSPDRPGWEQRGAERSGISATSSRVRSAVPT